MIESAILSLDWSLIREINEGTAALGCCCLSLNPSLSIDSGVAICFFLLGTETIALATLDALYEVSVGLRCYGLVVEHAFNSSYSLRDIFTVCRSLGSITGERVAVDGDTALGAGSGSGDGVLGKTSRLFKASTKQCQLIVRPNQKTWDRTYFETGT